MSDWSTYYEAHALRKPREQIVRALALCTHKEEALDLGAGTLVESMYLLDNGFKNVTAVDSSEQIKSFAEGVDMTKLSLVVSTFKDFDMQQDTYNLINAQYALPFYGPDNFENFIDRVKLSLKVEGIFVGQFFGVNDSWNLDGRKLAFQTKDEALTLLSNLEIVDFIEEEKEGRTAQGNAKHWHVFHFIAKKPFA